jgi:ribosomal-protein-alanine N-acetyltransferase
MILREFQELDFENLFQIDQACFPRGIAYSRRMLRSFILLRGADCLLAQAGDEITGFILTEAAPPHGQIITLDVLEAHRRSGVGSLLLREAESRMQAVGVRHVTLETATTNEPAIAFWQKHGYRTDAVLKRYYLGKLDAFRMRKALPATPANAGRSIE